MSATIVPLARAGGVPSRPDGAANLSSPVYQLTVMRRLSREWRAALSDREFVVLSYILDHTICWGRASYRFTYRGFAEGTPVSPAGLNKTKKQVTETLRSLEALGAIAIDPNKRDGLTITPNPEWNPMGFPVPKRLRGSEIQPPGGGKSTPQGEGNPTPLLEEHLEEQDRRTVAPAIALAGSDNPLKISSEPKKTYRHRTRPTQPAKTERPRMETTEHGEMRLGDADFVVKGPFAPAKPETASSARQIASTTLKNPGALERTWKAAWAMAFADVPGAVCPAWTKAELGMVKSTLTNRWEGDAQSLHQFIEWLVNDWANIVGTHFAWMKRDPAPSLPSVRFVMTFKDRFFQAWNRRSVDRAIDGLTGEERRRRDLMLRKGKTLEEANLVIAEEHVRARLRNEIAQGKEDASRTLRIARVEIASAEKRMRETVRRAANLKPLAPAVIDPFANCGPLADADWDNAAAMLGDLMVQLGLNNQDQFKGA